MKKSLTLGFSPWGNYAGDIAPFDKVFDKKQNIKTDGFAGVDAIILWGGTDVHPSYYDEPPYRSNGAPTIPSARDEFEWKAMLYAKKHNLPIIGVCRGAQFLCVFAGGKLVQDCSGHGQSHSMDTIKGKKIWTTSSHHQMMIPEGTDHTLIAWSDPHKSTYYLDGWGKFIDIRYRKPEPEIVYFHGVRGLAIQGHPEWDTAEQEYMDFCNELVVSYLFTGG